MSATQRTRNNMNRLRHRKKIKKADGLLTEFYTLMSLSQVTVNTD